MALIPVAPDLDQMKAVLAKKRHLLQLVTQEIERLVRAQKENAAVQLINANCVDEEELQPSLVSLKGVLQ